jgi:hypothetical protein
MDYFDLRQGGVQRRILVNTVHGSSGTIKCLEVLEWLQNWRLHKKGSVPWC